MRLLKGLAALAALLAGLVGIPAALLILGGNPLPRRLDPASFAQALLRPDDGTILIGLITLVGWVAWLLFAVSLLAELVNLFPGRHVRLTVPGLGGPQRLVAGLLLAVVALGGTPAMAAPASPVPTLSASSPGVVATAELSPGKPLPPPAPTEALAHRGAVDRALSGSTGAATVDHVVKPGDDLWSLAERYYGEGRDWRKIARANPTVLTGGPDRLEVGWRLTVPDVAPADERSTSDDKRATSEASKGTVVVRVGDSLSSIAEDSYGDSAKWREIFEANRSSISDPDEIAAGARLTLPARVSRGTPAQSHQQQSHQQKSNNPASRAEPAGAPTPREEKPQQVQPGTQRAKSADTQPPASPVDSPGPSPQAGPSGQPPPSTQQVPKAPADVQQLDAQPQKVSDVAPALLGVGGVLAAALLGGLLLRRRSQLQVRPVGRRVLQPGPAVQRVETALGHLQQPLTLQTLDLATRAVAVHAVEGLAPLPPLMLAKVSARAVELVMTDPTEDPPLGFVQADASWTLDQQDAGYLATLPGVQQAARPFPTLVSLGVDGEARQVLADLEAMGLLALRADRPGLAGEMMAAMAVELSFAPWADEMALTVVGDASGLPDALGKHNVTTTREVDVVLDRLEQRAAVQRSQADGAEGRQLRLDPDLGEAWTPEVILVNSALTSAQSRRLLAVTTSHPRTPVAAVVAEPVAGAPWTLELTTATTAGPTSPAAPHVSARLQPVGLVLAPQLLTPPVQQAVVALVEVTGSEATTPAPWWDHTNDPPDGMPPDPRPYQGRRFGEWGQDSAGESKGSGIVTQEQQATEGVGAHPVLRLLGPVELVGAGGTLPPRAGKQCLEYCGWLLENPATTAQAMAAALVVAEGTRRSNMSRLRTWLGADSEGSPYLPDAYTGRIMLHSAVSSDWQRLQILTAGGVNRTSTSGLRAALELVRGAPLADAAPGQWHWAEGLRTDMISVIRDIGVEVTSRAIGDHDIDLARWAASRALAAAPGDELLMAARIRTEHQAGNVAETERLTLALAGQARILGVDLDAATVVLLQEVMEGRVRAQAVGAPS